MEAKPKLKILNNYTFCDDCKKVMEHENLCKKCKLLNQIYNDFDYR